MARPVLHVSEILQWADAYHAKWKRWPNRDSGPVDGRDDVTWCGIDLALRHGNRGLPKGWSLRKLLADRRGIRTQWRLPRYTFAQILAWADDWRYRTGEWPGCKSGPIPESGGETWCAVQGALVAGGRSMPGGSSLARLLTERRGKRNLSGLPDFTVRQVLSWADSFHRRKGRWPRITDGPIPHSNGETWRTVANAFSTGTRGLPKGSLGSLLARHRKVSYRRGGPALTTRQILSWARAHHRQTGLWPTHTSGAVPGAAGLTWNMVHGALRHGRRGLPGGSSLYRLLGTVKRKPASWVTFQSVP